MTVVSLIDDIPCSLERLSTYHKGENFLFAARKLDDKLQHIVVCHKDKLGTTNIHKREIVNLANKNES